MKALIVAVEGVELEQLREASGERLAYLQWLMQIGCYGKLAHVDQPAVATASAIADELVRAGKRVRNTDAFAAARALMRRDDCDGVLLSVNRSDQLFDGELAELLGSLDKDATILVIFRFEFIWVTSANLLRGEIEAADWSDITATLVELAGDSVPNWLQGQSLLKRIGPDMAQESGYTEDEEVIIRARLDGLGYIE